MTLTRRIGFAVVLLGLVAAVALALWPVDSSGLQGTCDTAPQAFLRKVPPAPENGFVDPGYEGYRFMFICHERARNQLFTAVIVAGGAGVAAVVVATLFPRSPR